MTRVRLRHPSYADVPRHLGREDHRAAGQVRHADPATQVLRRGHGDAGVPVAQTDQAETVRVT